MEFSRWREVPMDIIREQFYYLNTADQFKKICEDPVIFKKICQDGNHEIWQELFRRDLSDEIILDEGETVMNHYLKAINFLENKKDGQKLDFAVDKGYEKLVQNIIERFPSLYRDELYSALSSAIENIRFRNSKYPRLPSLYYNFDYILSTAPKYGDLSFVRYLVENGAHIQYGQSLLSAAINAIESGDYSIIDYLISQGANVKSSIGAGINQGRPQNVIDLLTQYLPKPKTRPIKAKSKTPLETDTTQCQRITKSGQICCRNAQDNSQYCWQHQ